MLETSADVTRSGLGWLRDMRGSEADVIIELDVLGGHIGTDEEDMLPVSSIPPDTKSFLGADVAIQSALVCTMQGELATLGGKQYVDAEQVENWTGNVDFPQTREACNSTARYGLCGLDALNLSFEELNLSPISMAETLTVLDRSEENIRCDGMTVLELEQLSNLREHSIAMVDCSSRKRYVLSNARYRLSLVNIGMDSPTHFVALSQR